MKNWIWLLVLFAALSFEGCARKQNAEPVFPSYTGANNAVATNEAPVSISTTNTPAAPLLVQPADLLTGRISRANANLKFVVITFPIGKMASLDQRLNVYRAGLKVGELTVTGPQRDDSIVADITAGEALEGDEVRDK